MKTIHLLFLIIILSMHCKARADIELKAMSLEIVALAQAGKIWESVNRAPQAQKNSIRLLRLNFSSQQDLLNFARADEANFSFNANLCNNEKKKSSPLFVLSGVRIKNQDISPYSHKELKT